MTRRLAAPLPVLVTINGRRLDTSWIGASPANAPVIVFLHEGLGSISLWRDFPSALCARTGCSGLVYSRDGHGNSDPVTGPRAVNFMHAEALELLPKLLDHFDIRNPILFGHSDGASIALIHAGGSGRQVSGLVLEAPHVFVEPKTLRSIEDTRNRYRTTDLPQRLARHHAHIAPLFIAWTDIWLSPAFRAWNIEHYARAITAPMLIVQGKNDEYGTSRQVSLTSSATRGKCRILLLERCGHAPHIDRRHAVERAAAGFVGKVIRKGLGEPPQSTRALPRESLL